MENDPFIVDFPIDGDFPQLFWHNQRVLIEHHRWNYGQIGTRSSRKSRGTEACARLEGLLSEPHGMLARPIPARRNESCFNEAVDDSQTVAMKWGKRMEKEVFTSTTRDFYMSHTECHTVLYYTSIQSIQYHIWEAKMVFFSGLVDQHPARWRVPPVIIFDLQFIYRPAFGDPWRLKLPSFSTKC